MDRHVTLRCSIQSCILLTFPGLMATTQPDASLFTINTRLSVRNNIGLMKRLDPVCMTGKFLVQVERFQRKR